MTNNEKIMHWQNENRTNTSFWSIHGRIRRKTYALWIIPCLCIFLISKFFLGLVDTTRYISNTDAIVLMIVSLMYLASIFFMIFLGIKRLHDCNYKGWWILIPFVNLAVFFVSGTKGNNRFGTNPRLSQSHFNDCEFEKDYSFIIIAGINILLIIVAAMRY